RTRPRPSGCACPAGHRIRRRSLRRDEPAGAVAGARARVAAPVAPVGGVPPGPRAPRQSHAPDPAGALTRGVGTAAGTRGGTPDSEVAAASPLDRFLLSLRAKDASEHTLRSYATAVGAYLDWLAEQGADWRSPARTDLRAYLARLVGSGVRTSVSQRLAAIRSFHRFAARAGLAAGDPWGSIATPRLPRRLPRVLEVDQIERLLAAVDDDERAATDGRRRDPALSTAIAIRDRALIEVAYAAGLRISELAAAELANLDLRRGEIRVLGKGRKERIGLLGRPAIAALEAYLELARPELEARRRSPAHSPAEAAATMRQAEPGAIFLNHDGAPIGVR